MHVERFFGKLVVNSVLSENSFIIGLVRLVKVGAIFLQICFVVFFFDSRAKARLIHLDLFLKADFLGFFRKVKIGLLSKNGHIVGTKDFL